jgi:hypothetical protein
MKMDYDETAYALAIASDNASFVLGTDYWLRAHRADGSERWKTATPAAALGVNISQDGRLIAAAFSDGIIRWYRLSSDEELLSATR